MYEAPVITNVVNGVNNEISVFGKNFGLATSGGTTCGVVMVAALDSETDGVKTYKAPVQASVKTYGHTELRVKLPDGFSGGKVQVITGVSTPSYKQSSNEVPFLDFSPIIIDPDNKDCNEAGTRDPADDSDTCSYFKYNPDRAGTPRAKTDVDYKAPPNSGGGILELIGEAFTPNPKVFMGPSIGGIMQDRKECVRVDDEKQMCNSDGVCHDCDTPKPGDTNSTVCSNFYGAPGAPFPLTYQRCNSATGVCTDCSDTEKFEFYECVAKSDTPGTAEEDCTKDGKGKCHAYQFRIKCAPPKGQGANIAIAVVINKPNGDTLQSLPVFMKYAEVDLDDDSKKAIVDIPTQGMQGDNKLTLTGENFGTVDACGDPTIEIEVNGAVISKGDVKQTDTKVEFALPAGFGSDPIAMRFRVPSLYFPFEAGDIAAFCPVPEDNQYVNYDTEYRYGPPVLNSVSIIEDSAVVVPEDTGNVTTNRRLAPSNTQGINAIELYGENFGTNIAEVQVYMSVEDPLTRARGKDYTCDITDLAKSVEANKDKGFYTIKSYGCAGDFATSIGAQIWGVVGGGGVMATGGRKAELSTPKITSSAVKLNGGEKVLPTAGGTSDSEIQFEGTAFDKVCDNGDPVKCLPESVTVGGNPCASKALCDVTINNTCTNSKKKGTYFGGKCYNLCENIITFKTGLTRNEPASCNNKDMNCTLICDAPSGQGKNQKVTVAAGIFRSSSLEVSYAPPDMCTDTNANVCWQTCVGDDGDDLLCTTTSTTAKRFGKYDGFVGTADQIYTPPTEGATLNLFGENLGGFGGKLVLTRAGSISGSADDETISGSELTNTAGGKYFTVTIPPGSGAGHKVYYEVGGQKATLNTTFDYAPPKITMANPKTADTDGSTLLTLTGKNFGIDPKTIVSIGDCPDGRCYCNITSITHTQIVCMVPVWQGKDLPVNINAGGLNACDVKQTDTTKDDYCFLFSFTAAEVTDVSYNGTALTGKNIEVPTSGGAGYITMTGTNFGSKGLLVIGAPGHRRHRRRLVRAHHLEGAVPPAGHHRPHG
jgi:hypothetical protein